MGGAPLKRKRAARRRDPGAPKPKRASTFVAAKLRLDVNELRK
jgi:hypothetical protein